MRSKIKGESDCRQRTGLVKTASHSVTKNASKPLENHAKGEKNDQNQQRILKKIENFATVEDKDVRVINQSVLDHISMHLGKHSCIPKDSQLDDSSNIKLSRSMISSPKHFGIQQKPRHFQKHQRVVSALANDNSMFEKFYDEKKFIEDNCLNETNLKENIKESYLLDQNWNHQSSNQKNFTTISVEFENQKENKGESLGKQDQIQEIENNKEQIYRTEANQQMNFDRNYFYQNQNVRGYFRREQYQEKENRKYKDRELMSIWQQQIVEKKMKQEQNNLKGKSNLQNQNASANDETRFLIDYQGCSSQNKIMVKRKNSLSVQYEKDIAANTSSTTDNSNTTNNNTTQTSLFIQKNKQDDNAEKNNSQIILQNMNNIDKEKQIFPYQNIFNLQRSQSLEQKLNDDYDSKNETANFKPQDFENVKSDEKNQNQKQQPAQNMSQSIIKYQKPYTSQSISPKIGQSYPKSRNTSSHTAVSNDKMNSNNDNSLTQANNNTFSNNNSFVDEQHYQQQIIAQISRNCQKNLFQLKNVNKMNISNQPSNNQSIICNNNNNESSNLAIKNKIKSNQNQFNIISQHRNSNSSEVKGRIRLSPISKCPQPTQNLQNNQANQQYNSFLNELQEFKINNAADSSNIDVFTQNQKQSILTDDNSTEMNSIDQKSQYLQNRQQSQQKKVKKSEADCLRQNNSMCCDNRVQNGRKRINNSCNKQYLVSEGNQQSSNNTNEHYINSIYAYQARRKSDDHLEVLQISTKKFQQRGYIEVLPSDLQQQYEGNKIQKTNTKNERDNKLNNQKEQKQEHQNQQMNEGIRLQHQNSSKVQKRDVIYIIKITFFIIVFQYFIFLKESDKTIQSKIRASTANTSFQKRGVQEKLPNQQKQIYLNQQKDQQEILPLGGVFYNKEDNIYTFYNGDSSHKNLQNAEGLNDSENRNEEKLIEKEEQKLIKENASSQDVTYHQQNIQKQRKLYNKTQSEKKTNEPSALQIKVLQNSSVNEFLNDNQLKNFQSAQASLFTKQDPSNDFQKYNYFVDFDRSDSSANRKCNIKQQVLTQPSENENINNNFNKSLFNKDSQRLQYANSQNKQQFNSCCNSPFLDNKIHSFKQLDKIVNPFQFDGQLNQKQVDQQYQVSLINNQQQINKINNTQSQQRNTRSISNHYQQFYQNNITPQIQNQLLKQNSIQINHQGNLYQDLKSQKSLWSDISQVENSFIKLADKTFCSNNQQYNNNVQNSNIQNSQLKQKFPRDVFTPNVSVMRKKLSQNNQQ
ncbi:hypothetical protein TTHERM_00660160 (macronuclear) [Tetrahymena thermophila SB210]|uniref:Uncharacterized protein n=1 Tax=Tetrahymena thermophila (strain SB210) TaxID=312017 RepID=I7MFF7_TETTS|nr:hypothetical protein TTHERM_00660160 [Tetrahymena thermophila SB210]EAR99834.2 hypothetical protein TTHERM_00660160 [Tetrahymena thermophila SB210]|eukprot:XP_001020079.2 hypothetical protein TTHERM_00660160 [Tetrahymena thermophila SB210]